MRQMAQCLALLGYPMGIEGDRLSLRSRFSNPRALVLLSASVLLAARLFLIVKRYSAHVLSHDKWIFAHTTIFQNRSLLEIFRWQHGPHRLGLGGVLSKLIEPSL